MKKAAPQYDDTKRDVMVNGNVRNLLSHNPKLFGKQTMFTTFNRKFEEISLISIDWKVF